MVYIGDAGRAAARDDVGSGQLCLDKLAIAA